MNRALNKGRNTKTVVVTGDITIDWNILRIRRMEDMQPVWNAADITKAFCLHGGVIMLADLVTAIAADLEQSIGIAIDVSRPVMPQELIMPADKRFHHSYAVWAPYKRDEKKTGASEKVWRVQEFLGLYPANTETARTADCRKISNDLEAVDLVVLDDANLGFRENAECWPQALTGKSSRPWILIKMAKPVAQGELWEYVLQHHTDRLIVLMTANDLRSTQVQISRQISWERTAQDMVWELLHNHQVNALSLCSHVIVSFGTAGAILLSRKRQGLPDVTLFFDANAMEGEWGRQYKGYMIGYTTCLAGSIAREIMLDNIKPDLYHGIQSGVSAMRFLQETGYGLVTSKPEEIQMAFPSIQIAEQLAKDDLCLAVTPIRIPVRKPKETSSEEAANYWSILGDTNPFALEGLAAQIVREGLESILSGVPIEQFRNLKTADRREIEGFHSIGALIKEYCERRQQKPLSIAVFGPPGAGKSFAVTEVAASIRPEIEPLNFNLSQFKNPEELISAFHQIRDKALKGKIPLVFWDEFDTPLQGQPLGWLRYFLAPMSDGEFQEGQVTHPIGRSVFVFAGGTKHSMEAFSSNINKDGYHDSKLPDFISRLKGYLNILGPNRQDIPEQSMDNTYIIRRAIILRSVFERFAGHLIHSDGGERILNIDAGLLRAFLMIREYRHGARSIETIVNMSQLAGKTAFERSSLPTEAQLNLHLDGREFYALMRQLELGREVLEKLAEATHEVFCEDLKEKEYKWGPATNDKKKEHSALKPYAELPENEREQNRGFVRDIPNKLAQAGCTMLPASSGKTLEKLCSEQVEMMARLEHERWMKQKQADGWKHAPKTNRQQKLHQDLVSWEELSEAEKEKDRILVRNIPRILAKAGYVMVKLD